MNNPLILGIDPGKTGALAFLYSNRALFIEDMPAIGKEVNGALTADMLREFTPTHAYIEAVNSFGMGRQSAFNFGQGVGVIKGVLGALAIPYSNVTPTKWKKEFSLNRDKNASRLAAIRLFPDNAGQFARKKDDGRAEAALIALWGRRHGAE
jgi:crossover junction endodeoxyribonuclease RuvC